MMSSWLARYRVRLVHRSKSFTSITLSISFTSFTFHRK